jgi:hypothetical protein
MQEFIRVKSGASQEVLNVQTLEYNLEMLQEKQSFVRALIRVKKLRRVVMILISNTMVPIADRVLL